MAAVAAVWAARERGGAQAPSRFPCASPPTCSSLVSTDQRPASPHQGRGDRAGPVRPAVRAESEPADRSGI